MLHIQIITPRKIVHDEEAESVTAPSAEGEITLLPHHDELLSLLQEGIVTIRNKGQEEYVAIGGGYLETDGKSVRILVSRAYQQDEIDEEFTKTALENAKKIISETKSEKELHEAAMTVRRSIVDLKLLRKRRKQTSV